MTFDLHGKKVAILVADGFEETELSRPRAALAAAGAETVVVSPCHDLVQSWTGDDYGSPVDVDVPLNEARAGDFDALLLPGGVMNPDTLRTIPRAVDFVRAFFDAGKPVAAICHGPWMLAEAGVVRGRRVTSFKSIKTDLINAGAEWVDEPVVVDNGLVTSRQPGDIPHFNTKMLEEFAEGIHAGPGAQHGGGH
ncbi:MAG: type 1 glutamine amidotransferase [Opitutae bacterium]|nr:type 1 glutamine amidotransferase [Opitutae bacterium]